MNCTSCLEHMAEFADAKLGAAAAADMRAHMDECAACRAEFASLGRTLAALDALPANAPSHRLRASLMGDIEAEKLTLAGQSDWARSIRSAAAPRRPSWTIPFLQVLGACALLVLGFVAGERTAGERAATERKLADLGAKVDTMGMLVEQSVLQKRTTVDRLATVMTVGNASKPTEQAIDGLINTMAFDPSVNVRLNALNALYAHAGQEVVRAAVLACLQREPNPLVQVSMIDFIVAAKAHDAAGELRKIAEDEKANPDVRESARRAIDLL